MEDKYFDWAIVRVGENYLTLRFLQKLSNNAIICFNSRKLMFI